MKYSHQITLTFFSHEDEDKKSSLDAFIVLFPFDLEENKLALKSTKAAGFNEKTIEIFEVVIKKAALINKFLGSLLGSLSEVQKGQILQQAESRLDNNLDFFIRIGKDALVRDRKIFITDSGNCFHLKINVAAFPKKREVALKIINKLFSK